MSEHEHTWALAEHWKSDTYENDNVFEPKSIFKSIWLCECGWWKTVWHTPEQYWNDQQPPEPK